LWAAVTVRALMRGTETINRAWINAVTMGMWSAYIASTKAHTDAVVVYDKFHITRHLCRAVDEVRRGEQRQLLAAGDKRLTGTRYVWLRNTATMSGAEWRDFAQDSTHQTHGLRLPQPHPLPQRHLLPPRRPEHLPGNNSTHERVKRHHF